MRILYVTAHYPPDFTSGATLQVRRLAENVAAAGHDVTVLAGAIGAGLADGEASIERQGSVTVHWIGTATRVEQDIEGNWYNPLATALGTALLEEVQPDVVHAHALQTIGADLLSEAKRRGITTVVTMHDMWWWCPRLFLVDRELRPCPTDLRTSDCACAAGVLARLDRAARLAIRLADVDQVLVPSASLRDLVVANGVDPDIVDVDENDVDHHAIATAATSTPEHFVRFVYVGGDHPLKGRDVVLRAARRLRGWRGWQLTAYGVPRPPGPWWRRWPGVVFAPSYDPADTAAVFRNADVLIIPSIARESFSLAAREALAAGVPVITSDCLGPTEVVQDGVNGLVVPTGDDAALADAMESLLADTDHLALLQAGAQLTPIALRDPAEHASDLVRRYETLSRRVG